MFKNVFKGYRNKSWQANKLKWAITYFMEMKAKRLANMLQTKSQRIPTTHMKWYLSCFCAIGLTLSLLSILAGNEPNKSTVAVKQMAVSLPRKFSIATAGPNDFQNLQQAVQMDQYFDSLLQDARTKGQADSFLAHHRSLQDSIRLLKGLYHRE